MRLVFVHGIDNQGRSEQIVIDEWLNALSFALSPADMAKLRQAEIVAPYYGDVLYQAVVGESQAGPEPIAQSAVVDGDEAKFYLEALQEMAPAAGVTQADILAEAPAGEAIEQGLPHNRRLIAVFRALERISPFHGRHVLKFLPQAFVYLNRPATADAIDKIVRPALTAQPCVIVAHSLGTVVTFKLLRNEVAARSPSYITLGSPLAVRAVKNAIGPVFARPNQIPSWLNGIDLDDAVTIGRVLTAATFGPGIDNLDDIDNGSDEPHAVRMYLRDRRIAEAIVRAVSNG